MKRQHVIILLSGHHLTLRDNDGAEWESQECTVERHGEVLRITLREKVVEVAPEPEAKP